MITTTPKQVESRTPTSGPCLKHLTNAHEISLSSIISENKAFGLAASYRGPGQASNPSARESSVETQAPDEMLICAG